MRRSFEDVLGEVTERIHARREPREQVLAEYPAYRQELEALLPVADAYTRLVRDPSAAYQARSRARIMRALEAERARQPRRGLAGWLLASTPRLAAMLAAVVLALGLGSFGFARASSDALPGSPLYGVKQAAEQARVATAFSPEAKSEVYAQQAEKRAEEFQRAMALNRPVIAEILLQRVHVTADNAVDQAEHTGALRRPMINARLQVRLQQMIQRLRQAEGQTRNPSVRSALEAELQHLQGLLARVQGTPVTPLPGPAGRKAESGSPGTAAQVNAAAHPRAQHLRATRWAHHQTSRPRERSVRL